ncbi:redoxin domain-containing protein [Erythrobacter sp. 3-20A1M]|mgnify:CR=1 FL=1|uniref:peroxiredoxin-like family protein n=1 Tax=Erythrobacter sp. 3-20A1M TaxID=2653850 RepID=UPI001BFCD20B|nr:peroxiredoxin-like family protein [Erythrobacter sp. 3-20A1M]QWC58150.1 redoxin domain-containing protein [Erythrobacter sp. 3-20A1M]
MLIPGEKTPDIQLPLTIEAQFELSKQSPDAFTMLVFYRGSHCPICENYLEELGGELDRFTRRGLNVFAISMDSKERAMKVDDEWDTGDLPLVYDLSEEDARNWGLYISEKREGSEEPDRFSEPGLFLIRPDGTLYMAQVQSAPFTRPDLDDLLENLDFIAEEDYPPRGTAT